MNLCNQEERTALGNTTTYIFLFMVYVLMKMIVVVVRREVLLNKKMKGIKKKALISSRSQKQSHQNSSIDVDDDRAGWRDGRLIQSPCRRRLGDGKTNRACVERRPQQQKIIIGFFSTSPNTKKSKKTKTKP
jgi:hypothetical protein